MAEPLTSDAASTEPARTLDRDPGTTGRNIPGRLIVWGALSFAFVGFLAFGSVEARMWRTVSILGVSRWELQVEPKSIATIWRVQGQSLPDVSRQWMMQSLYFGAILAFVACTVVGLRLLLSESSDEPVVDDRS